ncbi:MAG: hypothetical protein ACYDCH_10295 [Gaiellaceae bacterium]
MACSFAVAVIAVAAADALWRDATTVGCGDIIGHGRPSTYRVALSAVAVPPSLLLNVGNDSSAAPFSFWTKAGIVIRAGYAATVTVAPSLASRVHITWGGVAGTRIRFAPCRQGAEWNAYAGGFLARLEHACVPLIVSVGDEKKTLLFGVGRRCSP